MRDGRIDDEMIEISDPNEEPAAVEPPPKVVIEYRERGIPWMMVPPLLVICVVGTVFGYKRLTRDLVPSVAQVQAPTPPRPVFDGPIEPSDDSGDKPTPPTVTAEKPEAKPIEVSVADTPQPELPPVATSPVSAPAAVPAPAAIEPPPAAEAPPTLEKPAEPANFPRVTGLGFDPRALEAEKKGEQPPADPAIAPAARQDPVKPDLNDPKNLPEEMDPELLPPDPRLAKVRQKQRIAETAKQVELDRVKFHNDLREICRIARDDYLKEVEKLSLAYGMQVDPVASAHVKQLLGQSGRYAGAPRPLRIDILRANGFPETLILEDIYSHAEFGRIGERNGPKNKSEAMHRAILFLLRYAPGQPASPSSRISTSRPQPSPPQPGPSGR